ncbi:hypothetical protein [Thalassotalea crassostreae]|uniref:hypothetical protein n=1 Tax=Thalassotalea crassostreae TaxID=1763536 RepID=UPI000838B5C7|nr:hypothetical protein [Thalassotalea crassostreae]
MKLFFILLSIIVLNGCAVGHEDFINFRNDSIGTKEINTKPYKWENSGELIRADFLISGQGLTDISEDEEGNFIYHYSEQEVLSNAPNKEWIGKCLFYYVVDPKTLIIKSWAFDEGGNPLSCRTWP